MAKINYTDVVLFSGGWESALCALRARRASFNECIRPVLFFVDYGQAYRQQELDACRVLAEHFGLPLMVHEHKGELKREGRVIVGRNEMIMRAAREAVPTATDVWFGARNPSAALDKYGDSNMVWAHQTAAAVGFKHVRLPALCMTKAVVKWRVRKFARVSDDMIFSTEGLVG